MRAGLPVVALLLLLLGASPGGAKVPPADPAASLARAMTQAERSLEQGELEIAESRYRTALLEGWLLLGTLRIEAGDLEASRAAFERAARSAVETRRPLVSLALLELKLGEAQAAASRLRGLLARDRADLLVRRLLPRALMAAEQVDEAIQEMEELRALEPTDLENAYALARAYLGQGRPEAAEPLLAELAAARPIPETRVLIGRTYRDFDLYTQARRELRAALDEDPRVRRAHYYLGTVDLLERGMEALEVAMEHFEAELRVVPEDPMASLYLGIALVERRRSEEAVPLLELASREVTERADAFQFLGRAYLSVGRVDEAIATFRRGLEIAEAGPGEVVEKGPVDSRRRQLSSLHFQLAQALRRQGDEEAAAVHFEAAKEHSARSAEGAREILEAYLSDEAGEAGLAASTWPLELSQVSGFGPDRRAGIEKAVEKSLVQAYFNLGVLKTRAGRFAGAADLYQRAAELEPGFPRLQYSLGAALFNSGRFEQATAPLTRALAETPGDETLRRMLALAWFNAKAYEQAAELLRDDAGSGAEPSLQYAYAVALVRSGRATEAEPVFTRLLAENPDWPELNVLLGQAHAQQRDFDAAVRYLRRALVLKPDVAEAHGTLGDIYLRQGKLAEAEEALRAELRAHPGDARAGYTLAVVLDLNRKPDEARESLARLLEAHPDLADARYLLGKILLAQGAAEEARAQLEAAASLAPGDANIRYQLAQAYQRLGQQERSRREFEEYRRLKKEGREGEGR